MKTTYFFDIILSNLLFLPEILLILNISFFILVQILILKEIKIIKSLNFSIYFTIFLLLNYIFLIQINLDSLNLGFNSNLVVNYSLNIIKILLSFLLICLIILSNFSLKFDKIINFEFYSLILIAFLSSIFVISTTNFISFLFCLELQSLCLYILVAIKRNSILVLESALKYFLIGSIASILTLFGIFLILLNFKTFSFFELILTNTNNFFLILSFNFFFSLIFFKLGVYPFHNQVPDIYQTSQTLITFFLTTLSKITVIFFLIYFFSLDFFNLNFFNNLFIFYPFLIITLILGAIKGLIQTNLKRIIAYSSFINLSFILLGLFYLPVILNNNTFLSRNLNYLIFIDLNNCLNLTLENKIKIASFTVILFYLLIYVFLNFLFFSFIILFQKLSYNLKTKEFKSISDLTNLDNTNNFLSYYLVTILLSFIGLPPFAGFFSKYLVLYQFFIYNFKLTSFIFLFFSIISSFYYFKIIKIIYFTKKKSINHKYSNLILLNNQKYLINYKTNKFFLNLLILINLIFNFGFPFFLLNF